ncbi:tRNA-dependent cyclodipeptide synthase [Streptomyces microflavus]|uniref:tRNA-dependent cyclodipeptide synthase n=1 Tax=Streptomyces microflavus TaxID=1919 RepID=UPI0036B53787
MNTDEDQERAELCPVEMSRGRQEAAAVARCRKDDIESRAPGQVGRLVGEAAMQFDFSAEPYTEQCRRVLKRADHALIGLSPWNSYFTPRRVGELVDWGIRTFGSLDLFIPSYEAAYTLIAAGVAPVEAVGRARRAVKSLRGPALRALARCGLDDSHLHTGSSLAANRRYAELRRAADAAYRNDPVTRAICRAVVRSVVDTRPGQDLTEAQLDMGARYAIAELPVLVDSPGIFDVASSAAVYHRHIDLAWPLLERTGCLELSSEQGFVVVTPCAVDGAAS